MKLELATKKLFGNLVINCYVDTENENGDFYMSRQQIGEALEYEDLNSFHKIIQRNNDVIGTPIIVDKKSSVINKNYKTELYSFNQLFQILRFTKRPKANLFMEWSANTLKELITGRAELKFKTQISEETYIERIKELEDKAEAYERVMTAPNTQHMNSIAKSLNVGRNKLFAFLREKKILMDDNTPYQRFIKANYFQVREQTIQTGAIVPVTYITGRGLDFVRKQLKKVNYMI
jgi:phage antirepressor YoqD-like protein